MFNKCEHYWHYLDWYYSNNLFRNFDKVYHIYCPKCDKEKKVTKQKYTLIMARQQVKDQYYS